MFFKRLKRKRRKKSKKTPPGRASPPRRLCSQLRLSTEGGQALHGGSARLMLAHDKTDRSNRTDRVKHNHFTCPIRLFDL